MDNTNVQTQETETKTEAKKTSAKKNTKTAPIRLFFRPVTADEIDVRVQNINNWKTTVLLYKDARVDQNILDETVGCYNWQKEYSRENQNCTVSIWDEQKGQWISKEDTGTESNTEKEKGLASDSFKRACFCWGIGRELYTTPLVRIPTEFIDIKESNGKKNTYDKFFVQDIEVSVDESTGVKRIAKLTVGIEHNGQRDWVWSWGGGDEIRTHKPSWCGKGKADSDVSQNSNQQNSNTPAPQSNSNAWSNQNAPQQNTGQGGWNNSAGGQKGSFGHGSNANSGNSTPKRKWGAG